MALAHWYELFWFTPLRPRLIHTPSATVPIGVRLNFRADDHAAIAVNNVDKGRRERASEVVVLKLGHGMTTATVAPLAHGLDLDVEAVLQILSIDTAHQLATVNMTLKPAWAGSRRAIAVSAASRAS